VCLVALVVPIALDVLRPCLPGRHQVPPGKRLRGTGPPLAAEAACPSPSPALLQLAALPPRVAPPPVAPPPGLQLGVLQGPPPVPPVVPRAPGVDPATLAECWLNVYWRADVQRWRFFNSSLQGVEPRTGRFRHLEEAIAAAMRSKQCSREALWRGPGAPPPLGEAEMWRPPVAPDAPSLQRHGVPDAAPLPDVAAKLAPAMDALAACIDAPTDAPIDTPIDAPIAASSDENEVLEGAPSDRAETPTRESPETAGGVPDTAQAAAITPLAQRTDWSLTGAQEDAASPEKTMAPPVPASWGGQGARLIEPLAPVGVRTEGMECKIARFKVLRAVCQDFLWSDLEDLALRRQGRALAQQVQGSGRVGGVARTPGANALMWTPVCARSRCAVCRPP
jgi:hypothetical protein